MRTTQIATDEYYHVYARGNRGISIFMDNRDKERLLFLLLVMQSPLPADRVNVLWSDFSIKGWSSSKNTEDSRNNKLLASHTTLLKDITEQRMVTLVNFTLMPNHFHLTVHVNEKDGLSRYMQKVLNAYTKYFNTKHKFTGHLFQGPYGAVHVQNDNQLLHLSAYIHKNPIALKEWRSKLDSYPWSSLTDYVHENRWGELLKRDMILEQFKDEKDYQKFIKESSAKEFLEDEQLFDSET